MNKKLLLTSAGFENIKIGNAFINLLNKPVQDNKILFIPTAAITVGMLWYVGKCIDELYKLGFKEENLILYNLDYTMQFNKLEQYDAIYITGGNPEHLLKKVKEKGFDSLLKKFIENGGTYLGVSAGSMLMSSLNLVNCNFAGVHCEVGSPDGIIDLNTKPDIKLTDKQALLIEGSTAEIIG